MVANLFLNHILAKLAANHDLILPQSLEGKVLLVDLSVTSENIIMAVAFETGRYRVTVKSYFLDGYRLEY